MAETLLCPPADFALDEAGDARAPAIDDVYFSADDGLQEARTVFLAGADLPHQWRGRQRYTVAELGFGTGLNVAALMHLWRAHRPPGAWLDVVSVEGRPLSEAQARSALGRWPEIAEAAAALMKVWPPRWKGAHRRRLDEWRVSLTVLHDEAAAALAQADFTADAWFLDGFAPARNPAMWTRQVFAEVARLSAPGARAATFTVAKAVRMGLAEAGFRVDKRPGFGRKKDRLEAIFEGPAPQSDRKPTPCSSSEPVLIIGGGIAAASLADALRARGRPARLIARGGVAVGASGGPTGLLTPRLEAADAPHVRATLAAFAYSRTLFDGQAGFHPEGVLRCAPDARKARRLQLAADMLDETFESVDAERARTLTGIADVPAGIFMHRAGRFRPAALVRALAEGTPVIDATAASVGAVDGGWRVVGEAGQTIGEAPVVVLAGGADAADLYAAAGFGIGVNPGWVSVLSPGSAAPPRAPVAAGRYVTSTDGGVLVGATHSHSGLPPPSMAHAELMASLLALVPTFGSTLGPLVEQWSGYRATTKDRLPIAGWGGDGLGLLSGFGARGFAHAPLLAEMLASDLHGGPSALERNARAVLAPARFG